MARPNKPFPGKVPVPSPTLKAIEAEGGVEVSGREGVRKISGARLRQLSTDTVLAIAEKFGDEKISNLLYELCHAECITKGGHKIPDNRTRIQAVTLILAYLVGRPIERQEIVTVSLDVDSANGLRDRLKNSPAMRDALRGMLAELDAVDIEATTS